MGKAISSSGYRAAAFLSIDDIIEPADARNNMLFGLELASSRIEVVHYQPKQRVGIFRQLGWYEVPGIRSFSPAWIMFPRTLLMDLSSDTLTSSLSAISPILSP